MGILHRGARRRRIAVRKVTPADILQIGARRDVAGCRRALFERLQEKIAKSPKRRFHSRIIGSEIEIVLTDDGNGFANDSVSKGNGLKNMRNRAEKLKSSLIIDTTPGKGTKISFMGKFPVKSVNFN